MHQAGNNFLAHERLAIMDPASGDQPLFNEDKTIIVTVNGASSDAAAAVLVMLQPASSLHKPHGTCLTIAARALRQKMRTVLVCLYAHTPSIRTPSALTNGMPQTCGGIH